MLIKKRICFYIGISFLMLITMRVMLKRSDVILYNNSNYRTFERLSWQRVKGCMDSFKGEIPKIIHQTWNSEIVPTEFIENIRSLVRHNPYPEWQYFWWTKETMVQLVHDRYPYLLPHINSSG